MTANTSPAIQGLSGIPESVKARVLERFTSLCTDYIMISREADGFVRRVRPTGMDTNVWNFELVT